MEPKTSKVSIVGAGAVGSTLAYAGLMRGFARTVALFDINKAKVEAEALDLAQGIQFMPEATVLGSDEIEVVEGSDVVVIAAGAKQKPGQSRMELAGATIALMDKVLPPLMRVAPHAIYLLVTNPVDVVTLAAIKKTGMDPARMFGSGTALDTSRLRHRVAAKCEVAVGNVHAYIAGEHGDSEVALWSSATIGGHPLTEWRGRDGQIVMTKEVRDQIHHDVMRSAYTIIEGKGATNYAVGAAGARIVEAILKDERRIMPVSTLFHYENVGEVCMSVPAVIGSGGIAHHALAPLDAEETALLEASARHIRETAERFGVV